MSETNISRNRKLMKLKARGYSVNELSREFVISPTRVRQIIEREQVSSQKREKRRDEELKI